MIESNWGGTIIEAWMPQEPLDLCEIDPNDNGDPNNANRNSVLYNAMIHPLIRLSIKGALWYQGIDQINFRIFNVLYYRNYEN